MLSACSESPDKNDYFPLNKGLAWTYQVTTDLTDQKKTRTFHIKNLGATTVNDTTVYVRRNSDNTDYYIEKAEYGIYRYGKRTTVELKPRLDEPPRMILPDPPEKSGQNWTLMSNPYTFRQVLPTVESLRDKIQLEMTYELAGLDETVTVPAGTFEHCVLVQGEGEFSMYVDPLKGYQTIVVTTREWYAPGVGMVKLERLEPLDTSTFKGGSVVMELLDTSFSQ